MESFEAFYASPLQHPWALWSAALAGTLAAWWRRDIAAGLRRYALALGALSCADAWLTSSHVMGVGPLPAGVATAVPLFFVLAGDLRFLLLIEIALCDGRLAPRAPRIARAAALTVVVPVLAQAVTSALPPAWSSARVLFLVYELAFLALCAGLLALHPRLRRVPHPRHRQVPWLRSLTRVVMAYYALWATADVMILAGSDLGFALRVLPNLLYYGGLVAAVAWLAPSSTPSLAQRRAA